MKLALFRIQVPEIIALKWVTVYKAICDLKTLACPLSIEALVSEEAPNENRF